MLAKTKVLEVIETLPDEFSIDDLVERLVALHKIEKGLDQADKGQTLSGAEAREQLTVRSSKYPLSL